MVSTQGTANAGYTIAIVSVFSMIVCIGHAKDILVGGPAGWELGTNYTLWARTQSFVEKDKLIFRYRTGWNSHNPHNVLVVKKEAYERCERADPIKTYASGHDIIRLKKGPHYYICGIDHHCQLGMRLSIHVVSGETPSRALRRGCSTAIVMFMGVVWSMVAFFT